MCVWIYRYIGDIGEEDEETKKRKELALDCWQLAKNKAFSGVVDVAEGGVNGGTG